MSFPNRQIVDDSGCFVIKNGVVVALSAKFLVVLLLLILVGTTGCKTSRNGKVEVTI